MTNSDLEELEDLVMIIFPNKDLETSRVVVVVGGFQVPRTPGKDSVKVPWVSCAPGWQLKLGKLGV